MSERIGFCTLGCRVNQYESSAIAERLRKMGYEICSADEKCGFYVVNTCAVTAESERKSRQMIRKLAKIGKVAVIGCASQLHPELMKGENVVYVGGCRDKQGVIGAITSKFDGAVKNAVTAMDGAPYEEMSISDVGDIFSDCRAYIKIEDGCNGKCSYCVIPTCRGRVRSRPFDEIVEEAVRLAGYGYKEIILTGIEVGAYNKAPLSQLIGAVSQIEGLERVRFGSLSPNVINDGFLEAAARSRNFMPHLHLSLQSCCDGVLAGMRRPYRKKDIFDRVEKIREYLPGCMLSADIIVGFPGESEEDYLETERAVCDLGIYHLHSFPYSEREGTAAAEMPCAVPVAVRHERNRRLIAAVAENNEKILASFVGMKRRILVEKVTDNIASGHTEEYLEAVFKTENARVGDICEVTVTGRKNGKLTAKEITNEQL